MQTQASGGGGRGSCLGFRVDSPPVGPRREEANELVDALENEDKERVISEAADLWFHSLVALSMKNLSSDDILNELDKRFGISGHEEKNNRNA